MRVEILFERAVVILRKVNSSSGGGKRQGEEFEIASFQTMERDDECWLSCEIGEKKKRLEVGFRNSEEREEFCLFILATNRCGKSALEIFNKLDTEKDSVVRFSKVKGILHKSIDIAEDFDQVVQFPQFLKLYYQSVQLSQSDADSTRLDDTSSSSLSAVLLHFPLKKNHSSNEFNMTLPRIVSFPLIIGEEIIEKKGNANCVFSKIVRFGDFYLTNYRINFIPYEQDLFSNIEIPLASMSQFEYSEKNSRFNVKTKDFRNITFSFVGASPSISSFFAKINRLAFCENQNLLFAFKSRLETTKFFSDFNGWTLSSLFQEYERLNLTKDPNIVVISQMDYEICDSYPDYIAIPSNIQHQELISAASFRSKNRVPVIAWIHSETRALLCRCSQPLSGLNRKTNAADRKLMNLYRTMNPTNSDTFYIFDARPLKAAIGNTMMGKGFEDNESYKGCKIEFLNIENIHAMRSSFEKFIDLVHSDSEELDYFSKLESTGWMAWTKVILESSVKICEILEIEGASVVIHCSDGWDRTSQLVSLSTLLMDPYYRSLKGFATLIEKDWLGFGHKFATRLGHADHDYSDQQRAPIFLQFLDAVYQILTQYPHAFEFNENFLLAIFDSSISCRFGTFLYDCEKDRKSNRIQDFTTSLWTAIFADGVRQCYTNPFYHEIRDRLNIRVRVRDMKLWEALYLRWDPTYSLSPKHEDYPYSMGSCIQKKYDLLRNWCAKSRIDLSSFEKLINVPTDQLIALEIEDKKSEEEAQEPNYPPAFEALVSRSERITGIMTNAALVSSFRSKTSETLRISRAVQFQYHRTQTTEIANSRKPTLVISAEELEYPLECIWPRLKCIESL